MPGEIKLLSAGAVQPGLVRIIEAFRNQTGGEVRTSFATAPAVRKRIAEGETVDVLVAPPELLDDLGKAGKLSAVEWVIIGRIGVGAMVKSMTPIPKLATVAEFKQSLLDAAAIVYNQASTGIYLDSLFQRLGIAAVLEAKITRYPDFAAVRDHIGSGDGNHIGFGATTVIIENAGKGIAFAGALPAEIQNTTTYAAAPTANACDNAANFLSYLATPAARAILRSVGID